MICLEISSILYLLLSFAIYHETISETIYIMMMMIILGIMSLIIMVMINIRRMTITMTMLSDGGIVVIMIIMN